MSDNRKRKRRSKFSRFMRRYAPSVVIVILAAVCVAAVIGTVQFISSSLGGDPTGTGQISSHPTDPKKTDPTGTAPSTQPTEDPQIAQMEKLVAKADALAAGYDYAGAIELIKTFDGYESKELLTGRIAQYTEADSKLVTYTKMDEITHIFFHSLIADPSRAFDGDKEQDGYNLYMATIDEFIAIMESMYAKGYVLVSPYDVAKEVTGDNGTYFAYGTIRLPEGKKPFIMSQDDVNYYGYMIGTGDGKNSTPVFADSNNDGFASRIVIGDDGYPTCEYLTADGQVVYGDYDLVPVLETFIQAHPDFSYHGARAILGVTGYEGVFGYRTKPSYEQTMGTEAYQKEVEQAKAVAQCLRDHGWVIASHSYGHPAYGDIDASRVDADSNKWETTVQPIVGDTDVILFPYGSDIGSWRGYTADNQKFQALYADGYRYFFNVDAKVYWNQLGANYYRGSRRNIDGFRMFHFPEMLADLFDVSAVFSSARPTPVPAIGSASAK